MAQLFMIYFILVVTVILLLVLIRYFPISFLSHGYPIIMYYKINLQDPKITVISAYAMHRETLLLKNNNARLIFVNDLQEFINDAKALAGNSYFIAMHELYSIVLIKALPLLLQHRIPIFIYLPIIISSNNTQYQKQRIQQLNQFIFSNEVKNIFSYQS